MVGFYKCGLNLGFIIEMTHVQAALALESKLPKSKVADATDQIICIIALPIGTILPAKHIKTWIQRQKMRVV